MSIQSDIYISRKEAENRLVATMLGDYAEMLELAVANMDDFELGGRLSSDLYFVNIEEEDDR